MKKKLYSVTLHCNCANMMKTERVSRLILFLILYICIVANNLCSMYCIRETLEPASISLKQCKCKNVKLINRTFSFLGRVGLVRNHLILYFFLVFVSSDMFLTLCGDIHPNPGPVNSKFLNIIHMNVNSLTANNKLDEIESLCLHHGVDIICLNETKLDPQVSDMDILLPGFKPPIRKGLIQC